MFVIDLLYGEVMPFAGARKGQRVVSNVNRTSVVRVVSPARLGMCSYASLVRIRVVMHGAEIQPRVFAIYFVCLAYHKFDFLSSFDGSFVTPLATDLAVA
jgi:hypothetical protein